MKHPRRCVLWLVGLCLAGVCDVTPGLCADDGLTTVAPADVRMSGEKLEEAARLFEEAVVADDIRGCVLLVSRDDKIVLHRAMGWRNHAQRMPMEPDTLFRIASNTKPIIATAILLLAEQGALTLDDPVGRHLPAFSNEKCRAITIRHLLSHTGGFRVKTLFVAPLLKKSAKHPDAPNLQLEVNRFAEIGPQEVPGTTYSYSNAGYNTLGAIVEVCSGQPLETYLTEHIYEPLEMFDTSNRPHPEKLERLSIVSQPNTRKPGNWRIRFKQEARMRVPFVRASGGGISTARDYARFCGMFLNRGACSNSDDACRLLSAESVAEAVRPQTRSLYSEQQLKNRTRFYGLGWSVGADGTFSHSGSEGTYAWVDPQRRLIGLVFTQTPGGRNPRQEFRRLVTDACQP